MIYPMFAMILLTFTVAGYLLKLRIDAVKGGEVRLSAFRLNNATDMPAKTLQVSRNYSNLFEVPVLFYAAGTLALALHLTTPTMVVLGWVFVISRVVHSWIHITNNNVIHRMQAFITGNVCVLLMWFKLAWDFSVNNVY